VKARLPVPSIGAVAWRTLHESPPLPAGSLPSRTAGLSPAGAPRMFRGHAERGRVRVGLAGPAEPDDRDPHHDTSSR
jgi:hypothetical protein